MAVLCGKLVDDELVEDGLDVLKVGHVTACAEDGVIADGVETLDVLEACEGAVGRCVSQVSGTIR